MIDHNENIAKEEAEKRTNGNNGNSKWNKLSKTLTNKEICAQSILFMIAGGQTTSDAITFVTYNLAMHPDYQEQLIDEIDQVLDRHVNSNL